MSIIYTWKIQKMFHGTPSGKWRGQALTKGEKFGLAFISGDPSGHQPSRSFAFSLKPLPSGRGLPLPPPPRALQILHSLLPGGQFWHRKCFQQGSQKTMPQKVAKLMLRGSQNDLKKWPRGVKNTTFSEKVKTYKHINIYCVLTTSSLSAGATFPPPNQQKNKSAT